jgi:hypothetical protein
MNEMTPVDSQTGLPDPVISFILIFKGLNTIKILPSNDNELVNKTGTNLLS